MDAHIRRLRKEELLTEHEGKFDEENAERVVSWLTAAENRKPVVLVGAGFTLNARDGRTGRPATRSQAPLWGDVVSMLAKDLGLDAARYDAPTLFEMYREQMKDAKLRDALCATVADSDLVPGAAHNALRDYQSEAIVTTNCLDTLLDRTCSNGWRRVIVDEDLSKAGENRDLIYLHGHRDFSDSWVMTRGQYEDFPRRRPVIVARVRQLLAQHPWLVLGFGMTDPNFHAITRLLGLEMRNHQPLSLALMPKPPSAAERSHWRYLGFEIASPAKKNDFADFLSWAIPKLSTTYSPSSTAAKEYINRGETPADKLRRFREVRPLPVIDRHEAYEQWKEQLKELLSEADLLTAKNAVRKAHQVTWSRFAAPPKTDSNAVEPEIVVPTATASGLEDPIFTNLNISPKYHPLASYEEVQWLSLLLPIVTADELARHFAWGVTNQIFEDTPEELPLEVIALRLAARAGWCISNIKRLNNLLKAACSSAQKYGREKVDELLKAEASSLKLTFPPRDDYQDQPHLQLAMAGYQALMNAKFQEAIDRYSEAAKLAGQQGLQFEEWVYTVGHLDALARLDSPIPRPDADDSTTTARILQRDALRERIKELKKQPPIEHWLTRADGRVRSVLQELVSQNSARERFRSRGGWGKNFSGSGHALWKSFRDLETVKAPPSLRTKYLDPLLPHLDATYTSLVIENAGKPSEWLDELLSHTPRTLLDRQNRDRCLVDALLFTEGSLTKSEVVSRLECASELNDVFCKADIPTALASLERSASVVSEEWGDTARNSQAIGRKFWPAFSAAARWAEPSAAGSTASFLIQKLGTGAFTMEEAVKAIYDLPWHAWQPLKPDTAALFFDLLTRLLPTTSAANLRSAAATGHALFALYRMLEAGLPADAVEAHLDTWNSVLTGVKKAKISGFGECKRAAFLLEKKLSAAREFPARTAADLFQEWFPVDESSQRDQREEVWATLADIIGDAPEASLLERLTSEVVRLLADEKAFRHYELNPHGSYQVVTLLAVAMKYLADERPKIGRFLVRLLGVAPNYLRAIAKVLVRDWWETDVWSELMSLIIAACGGGGPISRDGDDVGLPTRRQIAVLDLFGRLEPSIIGNLDPIARNCIQGFALAAVTDERLLVANHAAFSVVGIAKSIDGKEEALLYASAIRRIAEDPRVAIRSAVANTGPQLAERATSDVVRTAASECVARLQEDENAQVSSLLERAKGTIPADLETRDSQN